MLITRKTLAWLDKEYDFAVERVKNENWHKNLYPMKVHDYLFDTLHILAKHKKIPYSDYLELVRTSNKNDIYSFRPLEHYIKARMGKYPYPYKEQVA